MTRLTGAELAGMAKHVPEQLTEHSDDVRWAGRRLEAFENMSLQRAVRRSRDGYEVWVLVFEADPGTVMSILEDVL